MRRIDEGVHLFDFAAPGPDTDFGAFTAPLAPGQSRMRLFCTALLEADGDLRCFVTRGGFTIAGAFEQGAVLVGGAWYGWKLPVHLLQGDIVKFQTSSAGKILYLLAEMAPEGADS